MEIVEELPQPPVHAFESLEISSDLRKFVQGPPDKFTSWTSTLKHRPILFWLDTLCIPVAKEHIPQRLKAIESMAQLYAGARKVLVLDPYLQLLPSESFGDNRTSLAMYIKSLRGWQEVGPFKKVLSQ